jgi:hypothetical protein
MRQYERFRLQPMYTAVNVESHGRSEVIQGHAYDISEAGVRLELDEPLDPGEDVQVEIRLPGEATSIGVSATVLWVHGPDDDPAARRLALRFTAFRGPRDHARLVRFLGSGVPRVAA